MNLENKVFVVIGDRDGIPGEAIKACVETIPGAQIAYSATECFV